MSDKSGGVGITSIKKEVSVGLFAIIINLGFLKFDEIDGFVKSIEMVGGDPSIGDMFEIFFVGLSYLIYVGAVAIGLSLSFNGKDVTKALITALGFYFLVYFMLLMNAFNAHPIIQLPTP